MPRPELAPVTTMTCPVRSRTAPATRPRLPSAHSSTPARRRPCGDQEEDVAAMRSRRSCLAVPGSSVKMLSKAQGLPADQVFLDLEDAVAPLAKPDARKNI